MSTSHPQTGYAPVNGLEMYYEIHGAGGQPLVLLHGAFMSLRSAFETLIPTFAATRQVIAVEFQGHGRTADSERPIRYELLADDVAALLTHLGIERADVFGYSLGAGVALRMGIQHPERVNKLVLLSGSYSSEGVYPEIWAGIADITPEAFAGSPMEAEYLALAPRPEDWPTLVIKIRELDTLPLDWSSDMAKGIAAPTLLIVGDADIVRPEHAVEMFRLLGGCVPGDLVGLPASRLAIVPGATHMSVMSQTDLLLAMILPFLEAPVAETTPASAAHA